MNKIYGSTHFTRIDSTIYNFNVFKNGKYVFGFQIIYIQDSFDIANHLLKVKQFSEIAHVTFDKIKSQFFQNIL